MKLTDMLRETKEFGAEEMRDEEKKRSECKCMYVNEWMKEGKNRWRKREKRIGMNGWGMGKRERSYSSSGEISFGAFDE